MQTLHEDLLQDTLEHLTRWLARHPSRATLASTDLQRVAMTILRCRISDRWRTTVRHVLQEATSIHHLPSQPDVNDILLKRQALSACLAFMDTLKPEERLLMQLATKHHKSSLTTSDRDRKRLQRLRARLKEHLLRTMGPNIFRQLHSTE